MILSVRQRRTDSIHAVNKLLLAPCVLTPVIVQAGNEHAISLEPEFITPQDGYEKQDCEIAAGESLIYFKMILS